jgi:hypothetical protein
MKNNNQNSFVLGVIVVGAIIGYSATFLPKVFNSNDQQVDAQVISSDSTDYLSTVTEEFKKIEDKNDKILIYKLFSGAASFLEVCESLDGTYQFDPIIAKVQTSYGWNREKYPSFTDAVSEYLVSVDYDTPKPLKTKQERLDFSKIFKDLSEATKYE